MIWTGVICGFLFGFLLKRTHYCIAGGLRDVYLQKDFSGLLAVLLIIGPQSLIFFFLIKINILPYPEYPNYSLLALIIGSFIFGIGTVLASGCISGTLVKVGDGRFTGLLSLLGFILCVVSANNGILSDITSPLENITILKDDYINNIPFSPLFILIPIVIFIIGVSIRYYKHTQNTIKPSSPSSGLRYQIFEKPFSILIAAFFIGIVAGLAFLFNQLTNNFGGFAITGPLSSWFSLIIGGGIHISWGMLFISGIIFGSFICSIGNEEFNFRGSDGTSLLKSFIGGCLMGVGASLAKGCLI